MSQVLPIDVHFEFICPWCLIGKRNLERALQHLAVTRPDVAVQVRWKSVQLLPDLPAEGVPFAEFYVRRLGSASAVRARQAQVQEAAAMVGLDLNLQRIRVMPNTAKAHRLLATVAQMGNAAQVNALLERLFAVYFQFGEDIGQPDLLLRLAQSCGFDPQVLARGVQDDQPFVDPESGYAGQGVPAFVINKKLNLVGAQPPEEFLKVLQLALMARELELQP